MPYSGNTARWNRDTGLVVLGTVVTAVGDQPYDLSNLYAKAFHVRNNGPAALTDGVVEFSPDNVVWGTHIGIAGGTLGSATDWTNTGETTWKFWRVRAAVASGSVATVQLRINF